MGAQSVSNQDQESVQRVYEVLAMNDFTVQELSREESDELYSARQEMEIAGSGAV